MAGTNAQYAALQIEKVRKAKKLPVLYEINDTFFSMIQKRDDVEKVSTRTARIPLQSAPGGNFGYASFDGQDLGRGSGIETDFAQITPVGLKIGVELTKLVEFGTNSTEKAIANGINRNLAFVMRQFRRDLDAQLMTAGNGVIGTVSSVSGSTVTLSNTPFGARLCRKNMVVQVYDSTLTTNRGSATIIQSPVNGLGATQQIVLSAVPGGTVANDVIVPDGLSGASPVGLYGLPYHHNSSTSGTWMGISRSNTYAQCDLVNANSAGLAIPFLRLAIDKIMQNIGMEEQEALKSLVWFGHMAQKAAYEEIAFSISHIEKQGGNQNFDLRFAGSTIGGIKCKWSIHSDTTRLDLVNLDSWGRVEWKEIDFLEVDNKTVFPVYGASGGIATAQLYYLITGVQYFLDNPRACSGITGLALPTGY